MAIFTGTYPCKIDGKSRTSLPSDFRDSLGTNSNSFFLLRLSNEKVIDGCTQDFLEDMQESIIETYGLQSPEEKSYRKIFNHAMRISLDSTGRFVIPETFKHSAGLQDKAIFSGSGSLFQIRSEEEHASFAKTQDLDDMPIIHIPRRKKQ